MTKHRAASLRQLSFLFCNWYRTGFWRDLSAYTAGIMLHCPGTGPKPLGVRVAIMAAPVECSIAWRRPHADSDVIILSSWHVYLLPAADYFY